MGVRRTIKTTETIRKMKVEGKDVNKTFTIPWQTDYEWKSYDQIGKDITYVGSGLVQTGLSFGQRICIFATTRPEWQIVAQACFAHGMVVATAYPTLGADAIQYLLNETTVSHIVTQASLIDKILEISTLVPRLKYIIYFDDISNEKLAKLKKNHTALEFISYGYLMTQGVSTIIHPSRTVLGKDLAVIMYTSGSTGRPKGVMISHQNLISCCASVVDFVPPPNPLSHDDVFVAYLPLAHVLELVAEITFLSLGAKLGYSSPSTLRDDDVNDENGNSAGDLRKLRPTIMISVPLVLERLKHGILEQVKKSGFIKKTIFNAAYYLKQRAYFQGKSTPILDKFVFKSVAEKFGGRIRIMLSGGEYHNLYITFSFCFVFMIFSVLCMCIIFMCAC
jgi:long-chain acyl-CoA synthetase